eukprot:7114650-Alexandrium_andersonii.AAC.1
MPALVFLYETFLDTGSGVPILTWIQLHGSTGSNIRLGRSDQFCEGLSRRPLHASRLLQSDCGFSHTPTSDLYFWPAGTEPPHRET